MGEIKSKRAVEAAELEAKAKTLRRAEKAFWDEVNERLPEIQNRFNMSDKFGEICRTYGADTDKAKADLLQHILSEKQVNYYHKYHSLNPGSLE